MNRKWMIGAVLLFGLAISFTFPIPAQTAPLEVITLKYCEVRPITC